MTVYKYAVKGCIGEPTEEYWFEADVSPEEWIEACKQAHREAAVLLMKEMAPDEHIYGWHISDRAVELLGKRFKALDPVTVFVPYSWGFDEEFGLGENLVSRLERHNKDVDSYLESEDA